MEHSRNDLSDLQLTETNQNTNFQYNDPILRLTHAIENTFHSLNNMSNSSENSILMNRKSYKKLPEFSGDPLEWLHFKKSFDSSSDLGRYSDQENVTRLFEALKGEAKNVTKMLFSSGSSASDIMYNLELQFGNKEIILEKIVNATKELPNVNSGKINLVDFALNIKNTVQAIKSLNDIGYLFSPEFTKAILSKLPTSLLQEYARYAATKGENKTPLEKISDFLIQEAEIAKSAGIISLQNELLNKKFQSNKPFNSRQAKPKLTL